MDKLKALRLLLGSKGYFLMSEQGVASHVPLDIQTLEAIQDEVSDFDKWLEGLINELILEERQASAT